MRHAMSSNRLSHRRRTTEEHIHVIRRRCIVVARDEIVEQLVPVRSTDVRLRLQTCEDVFTGHLSPYVRDEIQRSIADVLVVLDLGEIQMDVDEALFIRVRCQVLLLLLFELLEEVEEPFEILLIPIDPNEVHLLQTTVLCEAFRMIIDAVAMLANRARCPKLSHETGENRCIRCDADSTADEDNMLAVEDITRTGRIGPIDHDRLPFRFGSRCYTPTFRGSVCLFFFFFFLLSTM